jgi:NCAIR mutase (PurE)-related protein
MDKKALEKLLNDVKKSKLTVKEAIDKLKFLPYEELGFAKVDSHRNIRQGFPEVIFCEGKTSKQVLKIIERLDKHADVILATRANKELFKKVSCVWKKAEYNEDARIIKIIKKKAAVLGRVTIVTGGTSDIPVAEEAAVTAEVMGAEILKIYDAGVAGLHRLLANKKELIETDVIVVVAGMEGALASVVGGMVDKPVIAVPTSIGYGANFGGIAPLLTMLNSCAAGVSVVNIDNGFGAGYMAGMILKSKR